MATPLDPGSHYVLPWEEYTCSTTPGVLNWRTDYAANVSHPNGEPAFRIACPPDPVRSGQRSARFQLNKGDPLSSGSARAELKTSCCELANAERWYAFSIYLPADFASDSSAEILTQWHQYDYPSNHFAFGSPPLAIMTKAGSWHVSVRQPSWDNTVDPSTNNINFGAYETGRWTDFLVHMKWSAGPDGVRTVWINGRNVHDFRGQNKFNEPYGSYMKFGIYKWDWAQNKPSNTTQRVIYYDNLYISASGAPRACFDPREIYIDTFSVSKTVRVGLKDCWFQHLVPGTIKIFNPDGTRGEFATNTDFTFTFKRRYDKEAGEWLYPNVYVSGEGYGPVRPHPFSWAGT